MLANVLAGHADDCLQAGGEAGKLQEGCMLFLSTLVCSLESAVEAPSSAESPASSSPPPSPTSEADVLGVSPLTVHVFEALCDALASYLSLPCVPPSLRVALVAAPSPSPSFSAFGLSSLPLVPSAARALHNAVSRAQAEQRSSPRPSGMRATSASSGSSSPSSAAPPPPLSLSLVASLLRLLGNILFECRPAQDVLGKIGLFAILNASSLGVLYLTVREYSIVAIRNALDGHDGNRDVVDRLRAQNGAENQVATNMGVRVNVDEHGQVKVEFDKDKLPKGGEDAGDKE